MPVPRINYTPEQIAWRDETIAILKTRGIPADGRSYVLDPRAKKVYVPDENAHNLGKVREVTIDEVVEIPYLAPWGIGSKNIA